MVLTLTEGLSKMGTRQWLGFFSPQRAMLETLLGATKHLAILIGKTDLVPTRQPNYSNHGDFP